VIKKRKKKGQQCGPGKTHKTLLRKKKLFDVHLHAVGRQGAGGRGEKKAKLDKNQEKKNYC